MKQGSTRKQHLQQVEWRDLATVRRLPELATRLEVAASWIAAQAGRVLG